MTSPRPSIYLFDPAAANRQPSSSRDKLKTEYRKLYGDAAGLTFVDNEIARMEQEMASPH